MPPRRRRARCWPGPITDGQAEVVHRQEGASAGWAATAATTSPASRRPSRSARRSTTGARRTPSAWRSRTSTPTSATTTTSSSVRDDPKNPTQAGRRLARAKDGKQPYEKFFAEALEHHQPRGLPAPEADGAAQLRLQPPARLGRPAAHAAVPVRPRRSGATDESDEDYRGPPGARGGRGPRGGDDVHPRPGRRADPLKYVNTPDPDRLAEVKGRQVLDKFNCAGCHQVRPGVYEFKPTQGRARTLLEDVYQTHGQRTCEEGPRLPRPQRLGRRRRSPCADRLIGLRHAGPTIEDDEDARTATLLTLRLTRRPALHRQRPAWSATSRPASTARLLARGRDHAVADPTAGRSPICWCRTWPRGTARCSQGKPDDGAGSVLPPPLIREGERVQPNWLYQFLLNPSRSGRRSTCSCGCRSST